MNIDAAETCLVSVDNMLQIYTTQHDYLYVHLVQLKLALFLLTICSRSIQHNMTIYKYTYPGYPSHRAQ